MKYRIKFAKRDQMKFIGHLDLTRLFQRAIRRADLPIAYSQGFNPHQILSFALPLSLGMMSEGEYLDAEMTEEIEEEKIQKLLQQVMPDGIQIKQVNTLRGTIPNAMAAVEGASYGVVLDRPMNEEMENIMISYLKKDEIRIEKKTKKQMKEVDIRPDILKGLVSDGRLELFLAAGSKRNLKPELVIEGLYREQGWAFYPYRIAYTRMDLYGLQDGQYISLGEYV